MSEVAQDALAVGRQIEGYEILEVLSADSDFSIVYRVRDLERGDEAALKEFFPQADVRRHGDGVTVVPRLAVYAPAIREASERFRREGEVLKRIEHANVVRVRRSFEANGTVYLAMDLVQGRTLQRIVGQLWGAGQKYPPEPQWTKTLLEALLEALEALHGNGIVHRDLKPANIVVPEGGGLLGEASRLQLIDFGSAKDALNRGGTRSRLAYTAEYAPPEIQVSQEIGPATDLYSVGATFYELLTGERARPAHERQQYVLNGATDSQPLLSARSDLQQRYGTSWLTALDQCLKLKKAERPQSVRELRTMLAGTLRARLGPRQLGPEPPPPPPLPPPKWLPWVGAAVLALLIAGGYALYESLHPKGDTTTDSSTVPPDPGQTTDDAKDAAAASDAAADAAAEDAAAAALAAADAAAEAAAAIAVPDATTLPVIEHEPEPVTVTLSIYAVPSEAELRINGAAYSNGDVLSLADGETVRVNVTAPGYKPVEEQIVVTDANRRLTATLCTETVSEAYTVQPPDREKSSWRPLGEPATQQFEGGCPSGTAEQRRLADETCKAKFGDAGRDPRKHYQLVTATDTKRLSGDIVGQWCEVTAECARLESITFTPPLETHHRKIPNIGCEGRIEAR